jgi:hypothetical protein
MLSASDMGMLQMSIVVLGSKRTSFCFCGWLLQAHSSISGNM